MTPPNRIRAVEAIATGVAGGALAAGVGRRFEAALPLGLVGALNGAISGWRGVYDWRRASGVTAFVLDSTWAIVTTSAAVVSNLAGIAAAGGYLPELSERRNRHVYRRGLVPRRGFAITVGNVVSGVGDTSRERRHRLVTDHEGVHVWQTRWFGPLFPLLYVGWIIGGGATGAVVWATRRRDAPFTRVVESCAYYLNPFEYWAYSRNGQWPPRGKVAGLGRSRPIVRPFVTPRR